MAGPSPAEVESQARTFGVPPIQMYAYAATYANLPADYPPFQGFQSMVHSRATSLGVDETLTYGYIQERGAVPPNAQALISWAQNHNYMDPTGQQVLYEPRAGANYLYADQSSATPTTNTTQPAPSGFPDLGALAKNPLVLGGVGLLAVLFLFGGKRR